MTQIEKIRAEIGRRKVILDKYKDSFETAACCKQELERMEDFIASLQKGQTEVDLEKELDNFIAEHDDWDDDNKLARDIARYFYELGRNAK